MTNPKKKKDVILAIVVNNKLLEIRRKKDNGLTAIK